MNNIDPYGLDVYGINVGTSGTMFIKTAYSFQVLLDTVGNFGIQRTREIGGGFGSAAGIFATLTYGTPNTIYDLEGSGVSASGSAWFVAGAINLPITSEYNKNSCGKFESFRSGYPGVMGEFGAALSIGTPEGGITGTYTDTLFSTSILGDIGRRIGSNIYDLTN